MKEAPQVWPGEVNFHYEVLAVGIQYLPSELDPSCDKENSQMKHKIVEQQSKDFKGALMRNSEGR